jgi:hypothetical protein
MGFTTNEVEMRSLVLDGCSVRAMPDHPLAQGVVGNGYRPIVEIIVHGTQQADAHGTVFSREGAEKVIEQVRRKQVACHMGHPQLYPTMAEREFQRVQSRVGSLVQLRMGENDPHIYGLIRMEPVDGPRANPKATHIYNLVEGGDPNIGASIGFDPRAGRTRAGVKTTNKAQLVRDAVWDDLHLRAVDFVEDPSYIPSQGSAMLRCEELSDSPVIRVALMTSDEGGPSMTPEELKAFADEMATRSEAALAKALEPVTAGFEAVRADVAALKEAEAMRSASETKVADEEAIRAKAEAEAKAKADEEADKSALRLDAADTEELAHLAAARQEYRQSIATRKGGLIGADTEAEKVRKVEEERLRTHEGANEDEAKTRLRANGYDDNKLSELRAEMLGTGRR